jgi:hypothetical protein
MPTYGTGESLLHLVRQRIGNNYAELFEEFVRLRGRGRERMAFCLWHENTSTEALSINVEEGTYICRNPACGAHGDFITFYMRVRGLTFPEAVNELARHVGVPPEDFPRPREEVDTAAMRARNDALLAQWAPSGIAAPVVPAPSHTIDESIVEAMHQRLMESAPELDWLNQRRGINRLTVERYQIGHDGQRYYIPIRDAEGKVVNIRRYKPNARRAADKMISWREGFGSARLWPMTMFQDTPGNTIFLFEGEMDTLLALQLGLHAITTTGGAGTWKSEWNELFRGRSIAICYDVDEAGRRGAQNIARQLLGIASSVKVVLWPYTEPDGFDFTDYIHGNGQTVADLIELTARTPTYTPPPTVAIESRPVGELVVRTLAESQKAEYHDQQSIVPLTVSGVASTPFVVPLQTRMFCGSNAGTQDMCTGCPMRPGDSTPGNGTNGAMDLTLSYAAGEVLHYQNVPDREVLRQLKMEAGIPTKCQLVSEHRVQSKNLLEVQVIPDVGMSETAFGSDEYVTRRFFQEREDGAPFIGANKSYRVTVTTTNDPKTQQTVGIITNAVPSQSDIDVFAMSGDVFERLKAFQSPNDLWAKYGEMAHELEKVTRIYERRDLMLAVDLTFLSPIGFWFQGERITRGWMECLVIGDSRTGKTTIVQRLMAYYRAGEFSSGENTSFAGLVGGLNELNRSWFTRWGRVPLNDRRLLAIDEAGNLPHEQIARMSSMRSSGIAEIVKIHTERTLARTRQIWMTNPRGNRPLSTYSQGVLAVKEMVGAPEDIARFDLVVTAASSDVALRTINAAREAEVPETFTSDLCHQRVMWAWSRKAEHVQFTPEATTKILTLASEMGEQYRHATEIPLVEPNEQRVKIARMSAAVACLFFSTNDGEHVIVRPEHAVFAVEFLNRLYAKPSLAFDEYAGMQKRRFQLVGAETVDHLFERKPTAVRALMEQENFTQSDIAEIFQLDERSAVRATTTALKDAGFFRRVGSSYYVKTPAAIVWLRTELATGRLLQRAMNGSATNGHHAAHGALADARLTSVRTENDDGAEPGW